MFVDTALREKEAKGQPVRVGMVGAGATGRAIALQLGSPSPGMRLVAIANRAPAKKPFITSLVVFPLALTFFLSADAIAGTYITNFPLTQNPISEGSSWINGKTVGLDWANVSTIPGLAYGTQAGTGAYDDSTAILAGTWGPNQTVQATAHTTNDGVGPGGEEVEIRLRSAISAHSNTGYEINFSTVKGQSSSAYMEIVKWLGPLGSFAVLVHYSGSQYGVANGDVLKATITGASNTIITVWVNGTQMGQVTDSSSPFTSGRPGMGFWNNTRNPSVDSHYGFTSFVATDGEATLLAPFPPRDLHVLP